MPRKKNSPRNIQGWKGIIFFSYWPSYVDDEIKNESVSWIPIWRACAINDGQEMDMDEQEDGTIPSVSFFFNG
jgi:hypothetical protein